MPYNKSDLRRFKGIDNHLNRQRRVKRKRLADIFGVDERQISRDVKYMKDEFEAPIVYDNDGYYYSEKFNMPLNLALSREEVNQLRFAIATLNQFQHLDIFSDLAGLIERIENSVRFKISDVEHNFIYFEKVPFYVGTELVEFFIKAIRLTRVVTFDYQSFRNSYTLTHNFHPYILKEHTNRWYVIGYLPSQQSITSFALERIVQNDTLTLSEKYFDVISTFNPNDYFKYTYGMTVLSENKVEDVILSFTPIQAKFFKSKPFHEYEIVEENSENFIVKMKLIPNLELIRKLASFGSDIKVLSPISLVERLSEYLQNALDLY